MLRIISLWTGKAGSPWVGTSFWSGTTSVDAQAAADQQGEILSFFAGLQAVGVVGSIDPVVDVVNSQNGDTVGSFDITPPTIAPANGNGMVPAATQLLVQLRTGVRVGGREIRGKFYVPGLTAGFSGSSGSLSPANAAGWATEVNSIIDGGPQDLLVWSRKNGTQNAVSRVTISTDFAVLRSRRD